MFLDDAGAGGGAKYLTTRCPTGSFSSSLCDETQLGCEVGAGPLNSGELGPRELLGEGSE